LSYSTGAASYKKQTCKQILSFAVCFSLLYMISQFQDFKIKSLNR